MESLLECKVCYEHFDTDERAPKGLNCQHTFCLPCIRDMVRTQGNPIECPNCRRSHQIPNDPRTLPNNPLVIDLIDRESAADLERVQKENTEKASQEAIRENLHRSASVVDHHLINMTMKFDSLNESNMKLQSSVSQARDEIKAIFTKCAIQIRSREEELLSKLDSKWEVAKTLAKKAKLDIEEASSLQEICRYLLKEEFILPTQCESLGRRLSIIEDGRDCVDSAGPTFVSARFDWKINLDNLDRFGEVLCSDEDLNLVKELSQAQRIQYLERTNIDLEKKVICLNKNIFKLMDHVQQQEARHKREIVSCQEDSSKQVRECVDDAMQQITKCQQDAERERQKTTKLRESLFLFQSLLAGCIVCLVGVVLAAALLR